MTTPICRCRVLYLGSAVPHITKDGLQGIQEPLRDLYPDQGSFSAKGIDSWLSVWSNGILLENVDESMRQITRFFNIDTLHYCAAIRYVVVPGNNGEKVEKFLPLDSPFARYADPSHPPLFACILRRTTGIKVLECHAFICKKEAAANALVRCCFHSYADSMQAKQLDENPYSMEHRRSQSLTGLNNLDKVEIWRTKDNASVISTNNKPKSIQNGVVPEPPPRNGHANDDDNYKIWTGVAPTEREMLYVDNMGSMRSLKSAAGGTLRAAGAKIRQMAGGVVPRPPPPPSPSLFNGKSSKMPKPIKDKKKKKQKDMLQPPPQFMMNGNGRMINAMRPISVMGHYGSIPPQLPYRNGGFYTERRVPKNCRLPIPIHEEPVYMSGRPLSPVSTYQPAAFPYEQYFLQYGTAPRNMPMRDGPRRYPHFYQPPPSFLQPPSKPASFLDGPPENGKNGAPSDDDSPFNTSVYKRKKHSKNGIETSDQISDDRYNNQHRRSNGKPARNGHDNLNDDPFDDNNYKRNKNHRNGKSVSDDDSPFNTSVYKKGKGKMMNGKDDSDEDGSSFNTGIYKKKGHMNERAFSYSIRQEHRSRSNSLANLQFFNNGGPSFNQNGDAKNRDELCKEKELAMLVNGLDLKSNGHNSQNFIRKKASAY